MLGEPYPLISGTLNLQGDFRSPDAAWPFLFSPLYCGAEITECSPTKPYLDRLSLWQTGGWLYLYGSGEYRKSSVCLARVKPADLGDRRALRYFQGLDGAGRTRWSAREASAKRGWHARSGSTCWPTTRTASGRWSLRR